jgi:hypothetical protein
MALLRSALYGDPAKQMSDDYLLQLASTTWSFSLQVKIITFARCYNIQELPSAGRYTM